MSYVIYQDSPGGYGYENDSRNGYLVRQIARAPTLSKWKYNNTPAVLEYEMQTDQNYSNPAFAHTHPLPETPPAAPEVEYIADAIGERLQFYFVRGSLSILIPLTLMAYYIMTYWRWLRYPKNSAEPYVLRGFMDDSELVNYSWFVVATFALNLGTYAFSGSIAAMVMTGAWDPGNARRLLSLASNSYTDPSKWLRIPLDIIRNRRIRNNGRLWNMLAILNIIGFVAWPLAGLTMRTEDGYALDLKNATGGLVIGPGVEGFTNAIQYQAINTFKGFGDQLLAGSRLPLPWGQIYVQEGANFDVNVTEPNYLPRNATSTPIFLTAQAEGPLIGTRLFGLFVKYDCAIVKTTEDFTILNQRKDNIRFNGTAQALVYPVGDVQTGSTIAVLRGSQGDPDDLNIGGVTATIEIGTNVPIINMTTLEAEGYIKRPDIYSAPGLDKSVVVEVAFWQSVKMREDLKLVENDIPELAGLYPDTRQGKIDYTPTKAIGCRCIASSDLGYADVNGITGRYSNFELFDRTPSKYNGTEALNRFENAIFHLLVDSLEIFYDNKNITAAELAAAETLPITVKSPTKDRWYNTLWKATPTKRRTRRLKGTDKPQRYLESLMQPEHLESALIKYYTTYALGLMYGSLDALDPGFYWFNSRVKLSRREKVLLPGVVPPEVVLVLLSIWAAGIISLACFYQFRKRWTAKLDTFNAFKFGVARPDGVRPEDLAGRSRGLARLEKLPGLVGDLHVSGPIGQIGLKRRRRGTGGWKGANYI